MTTILVVDDSTTDQRLVGGLLGKKSGWEVQYALDGAEALDMIRQQQPDIVLTDLQMPNVNGLQLVSAVKSEFSLVPVILMTAAGSEEIAVQALQQGAASYVPKRRLAQDLVDTVELVLSAAKEDRTHAEVMSRMTQQDCQFILENDVAMLSALARYLRHASRSLQPGDENAHLRIGVALEEALLNAFYHGNLEVDSNLREVDHKGFYDLARQRCEEEPYSQRRLHVQAQFTPTESVFTIRDEGPGFDPSILPDPADPENLERPCGRGVMLMRTFMDEVKYNDRGNEVTMIKRVDTATANPA